MDWNSANYPDHDFDTPASKAAFLRAYKDMTNYERHPRCRYCAELRVPIPMSGSAWAWESRHEPHCLQHEGNQEAATFRVVDNYGGPDHVLAESIWTASQGDAS